MTAAFLLTIEAKLSDERKEYVQPTPTEASMCKEEGITEIKPVQSTVSESQTLKNIDSSHSTVSLSGEYENCIDDRTNNSFSDKTSPDSCDKTSSNKNFTSSECTSDSTHLTQRENLGKGEMMGSSAKITKNSSTYQKSTYNHLLFDLKRVYSVLLSMLSNPDFVNLMETKFDKEMDVHSFVKVVKDFLSNFC